VTQHDRELGRQSVARPLAHTEVTAAGLPGEYAEKLVAAA
jgi:hypothetical protein